MQFTRPLSRTLAASHIPFLKILILGFLAAPLSVLNAQSNLDVNDDGTVNVLVIGTSLTIDRSGSFSPDQITAELQSILANDPSTSLAVNVVAENIYTNKDVTLGLGGGGTEYTWAHHRHSLVQYYYWPEGREQRMDYLSGNAGTAWDYVVIGSDPYFVENVPGYYSLGVNKIAAKVTEGGAVPLLLMTWPKGATADDVAHFEEFTYRTADGASAALDVVPAGSAWQALSANKKDPSSSHPSPNGAYVTAAAIYSHIEGKSASTSSYSYDDEIATVAAETVQEELSQVHYSGVRKFLSPFKSCDLGDTTISYNHTGTSSERGILSGLNWVFNQSHKTLANGGGAPISFNYGRANTNFEPNKRYQVDSSRFRFSFGFPMQDHSNHGNTSMLYGIDMRSGGTLNDTDVGTARYMIQQGELPFGRAIPIRTLYAQMLEAMPGQSAYSDSWHMNKDLDKASAAYMYTLLNGTCVLGEEPVDQTSAEWRTWTSHKIGYETAWNLMYLEGTAPLCSTLSDNDFDGFNSYVDCMDDDPQVNPNQQETVYNGIDDDCDPLTLDDDLDGDGFLLVDDCDDTDALINPDAIEIPGNGIDEDCDDMDGVSALHNLSDSKVNIYPTPVTEVINIKVDGNFEYTATLYDIVGKVVVSESNVDQLSVNSVPKGSYFLEILDLSTGRTVVEQIVVAKAD
ncbi:MAG: MopE-related protein [Saprospiraceae bacterium]